MQYVVILEPNEKTGNEWCAFGPFATKELADECLETATADGEVARLAELRSGD